MSVISRKGPSIEEVVNEIKDDIRHQMEGRAWRAALELRDASQIVLRGQRSGRRYKVPGTYRRQRDKTDGKMKNGRYYTASAPGEPPAVRTGTFRNSWQPIALTSGGVLFSSRIESDVMTDNDKHNLGEVLEYGTKRIAPRPHHDKIKEHAEPAIVRIYEEPYF